MQQTQLQHCSDGRITLLGRSGLRRFPVKSHGAKGGIPVTRIKGGQDLATALLFAAVGALGLWVGRDYPMGSPVRLGTGVFPYILCWCLIGTGAIIGIKALLRGGVPLTAWAWRPVLMIVLATASFALLIDRIGLVVTMVVCMTLAAIGTHETRWKEFAWFTALMVVIAIALFIWGLGMPVKVLPWN
jgi:putative tricarboxylic transport membrane protein